MIDRRLWRGIALLIALAAAGVAVFTAYREELDVERLAQWARQHRDEWWTLPAYFAAYALLDILFIPTQALSVAAVLLWGWIKGGVVELLAATLGAVFPFLIARGALRESISVRISRHEKVARVLEREGFTLLLILRVIPVVPYTILNYVAGLSNLPLWRYLAATLLGMIPSVFIFAYFVEAVIEGVIEPRDVLWRGLAAGSLLAMLVLLTRLAAPKVRRRLESRSEGASPTDAARHD